VPVLSCNITRAAFLKLWTFRNRANHAVSFWSWSAQTKKRNQSPSRKPQDPLTRSSLTTPSVKCEKILSYPV
jgi:hypothetical protein